MNKKRQFTPRDIRTIRRWVASGKFTQSEVARKKHTSRQMIHFIVRNMAYADVV